MVRGSSRIKVDEWTKRLARFRKSKLSVACFCQEEGVSRPSFYQWQRKLRKLASANNAEVASPIPTDRRSGFQEVQLTTARPLAATGPTMTGTVLTVCLPCGIQVHVADHLPAIQTVMRELASRHEAAVDNRQPGTSAC